MAASFSLTHSSQTQRPLNLVVLYGGRSAERSVSLESGANVADALRARGHRVQLVDTQFGLPLSLLTGTPVLTGTPSGRVPDDIDVDLVIPMVHGTGGEDGQLQKQLERLGLRYLGCSPEVSALTFNKVRTQQRLQQCGLPTPPSVCVRTATASASNTRDHSFSACDLAMEMVLRHPGLPVVVKPAEQGSSIGVSIVRDEAMLRPALELAFQFGDECLIEQYIPGREITVPVLDGIALPCIEICPAGSWYDYTAKYQDDATKYIINPAGVPVGLIETAQRACHCCGVTGIARVDLRMSPEGRWYVLEINTIPGMTSHSLVPMAVHALGRNLGEFLEECVLRELMRDSIDRAA